MYIMSNTQYAALAACKTLRTDPRLIAYRSWRARQIHFSANQLRESPQHDLACVSALTCARDAVLHPTVGFASSMRFDEFVTNVGIR
jgi:hypothetical protein